MKIRSIRLGKSAKFLTLLLASLLIGTANAAIFYSLTMQPQITTSTPVISFNTAPDTPTGSTVNNAWCSLTAKSYPNATLTYEKAVFINNTDSSAHTFRLRHVDITPTNGTATTGNWTSIKFLIYSASGFEFALNYTVTGTNWVLDPSAGSTGYYSIPANGGWWIRLETLSPADATSGYSCQMQIAVEVNE